MAAQSSLRACRGGEGLTCKPIAGYKVVTELLGWDTSNHHQPSRPSCPSTHRSLHCLTPLLCTRTNHILPAIAQLNWPALGAAQKQDPRSLKVPLT